MSVYSAFYSSMLCHCCSLTLAPLIISRQHLHKSYWLSVDLTLQISPTYPPPINGARHNSSILWFCLYVIIFLLPCLVRLRLYVICELSIGLAAIVDFAVAAVWFSPCNHPFHSSISHHTLSFYATLCNARVCNVCVLVGVATQWLAAMKEDKRREWFKKDSAPKYMLTGLITSVIKVPHTHSTPTAQHSTAHTPPPFQHLHSLHVSCVVMMLHGHSVMC